VSRVSPTSKVASRSPPGAGQRVGAAQQPVQLLEGGGRHQHLLALGEHRGAGQVAHGEPVAVGGHQAQAVGPRRPCSTPVRMGRASSWLARRDHLAQRLGQAPLVEGDGVARPASGAGGTRRRAARAPRTGAAGERCGPRRRRRSTSTRPGGRARTMSEASLAGSTTDAVALAGHRRPHRDGEVEVAAGEVEAVAGELEAHARRARAALPRLVAARPAVPRASTRTSRSHRNFTAARFSRLFERSLSVVVVVGPVDCGQPGRPWSGRRGCPPLSTASTGSACAGAPRGMSPSPTPTAVRRPSSTATHSVVHRPSTALIRHFARSGPAR
jgi:hypothetical protein